MKCNTTGRRGGNQNRSPRKGKGPCPNRNSPGRAQPPQRGPRRGPAGPGQGQGGGRRRRRGR